MPYLAAGAIAIGAGFVRERKWPAEGTGALVGTIALVVVASASAETRVAPLVRAFGLLLLMISVFVAVPAFQAAQHKKSKGNSVTSVARSVRR
jgi:peptidoglycan/LPS O-acetylase OafA/YrhL